MKNEWDGWIAEENWIACTHWITECMVDPLVPFLWDISDREKTSIHFRTRKKSHQC